MGMMGMMMWLEILMVMGNMTVDTIALLMMGMMLMVILMMMEG